jgi:hypothetical protein
MQETTMIGPKLVSSVINLVEKLHTLALLILMLGWELRHLYLLLFR